MSLISDNTRYQFTGLLQSHYDTFKKQAIIHKEPIKFITDIASNPLVGYEESSNLNNYSYLPVSGVFNLRVRYDNPLSEHKSDAIRELNLRLPKGGAIIQTEQDCRDYILNGKTERIDVDGRSYNIISDVGMHDYLGKVFYYFTLENTL